MGKLWMIVAAALQVGALAVARPAPAGAAPTDPDRLEGAKRKLQEPDPAGHAAPPGAQTRPAAAETDAIRFYRQISGGYFLGGVPVAPPAADPAALARLAKSPDRSVGPLAARLVEADALWEKMGRMRDVTTEPDAVRAELKLLLLKDVVLPDDAPGAAPQDPTWPGKPSADVLKQREELGRAGFDFLTTVQGVQRGAAANLQSAARGAVLELKSFPAGYRTVCARGGLTRARVLLTLDNRTGLTLHNCVVFTHTKPDKERIEKVAGNKVSDEAFFGPFADALGEMPALSAHPQGLYLLGWDAETVDKGSIVFVPEWKANARLEVPIAPARTLLWAASADVSAWSDDGFLEEQPLSVKQMARSARDEFNAAAAKKQADEDRQERAAEARAAAAERRATGSAKQTAPRERPPITFPAPRRVR